MQDLLAARVPASAENQRPSPRRERVSYPQMRIGFDGRWYGHTGVGNYVSELIQAIDSLDGDFEVILYENPRNPLERVYSNRVRRVPVNAGKYSVREQFELVYRCRVDRIDVFHSPFCIAPWLAPCPVVVTIHDLIPFLFNTYSAPKRKLIQLGYRLALKKAAWVIAVSETTRDDLSQVLSLSPDRIRVIHEAASQECFHPHPDVEEADYLSTRYGVRRPFVLISSAKNWRTKNLSVVLEALSICRGLLESGFQIVVFGCADGFREASLQRPEKLENVVQTGFVPTKDLAKLYRGADVFLMGSKYEGFGLPLLEAMSCGCAVVSSNGGSLAEVAGAGAVLVDPGDPQRMGEEVARLLRDRDARQEQQSRAKKRAADFSWETAARQTVSVYSEAATQK